MSLVDPGRPEASVATGRTTRSTVIVSLVLHVFVLAAVVVVPLFGRVTLPSANDAGMASFIRAAVAPTPPLPQAAPPTPAPDTRAMATSATPAQVTASVPLEAPTFLPTGEPPTYVPGTALAGGVDNAALSGLPGGVPGGEPVITAPPPPAAVDAAPIRVGGDIKPPRKLHDVAPVYPDIALRARVAGVVILEATISPSGKVVDVKVLRSVPLLDAAAVEAVSQWRYEPPRLNGTPIAVLLTVTVRFGP